MGTVSFTTLGCRLNQAESDQMAEELATAGFGPQTDSASPDVVVINTCTVTREATKASRMAIRRSIRKHPDAKIVVVGCYAVSDRAEIEAIEGVDVILGNDEKEAFLASLGAAPATAPLMQLGFRRSSATLETQPRVRANLKVQTGCDEWCTFCIIPKTRGPLRSMDANDLLEEARARVASGTKEIVLTGVHIGKFTYDSGGDEKALVGLFEDLLAIEGLKRLRLSSILSRHLTEDVLAFIASEPRFCRYLHVPLQSGDDGVLEAMHRPYRIDEYIERVERAKDLIPDAALATDIIVGFPTETDAAFENTMDVVRRLQYSKLHVFRYSSRPDTAAAEMPDAVHPDVKKLRSKRLIDLGNEIRGRFLRAHLDRPLEVLVEDSRVTDGVGICSGQTGDYVRVWFEGEGLLGETCYVQGTEVRADGIRGHLVGTTDDSDRLIARPAGR
ncbi:MAG: tRNA (N(6)-L-threonylcarbamoyladenosine(37)-C(2))-methylthiotransferase MtaB [Actinomycetota bacterium]